MRTGWKIKATSKTFNKLDLAKAINATLNHEFRERETRKHPDNKGSMIDIDNATEPEPEHEPDEPCTEKAEK